MKQERAGMRAGFLCYFTKNSSKRLHPFIGRFNKRDQFVPIITI